MSSISVQARATGLEVKLETAHTDHKFVIAIERETGSEILETADLVPACGQMIAGTIEEMIGEETT